MTEVLYKLLELGCRDLKMVEERLALLERYIHVMRTPNEWLVSSRLIMLDPTTRFSTQMFAWLQRNQWKVDDEQSDQCLLYEQMGIARIC